MEPFYVVLLVIVAAALGAVGGFFFARRYMMNYFSDNPPIDADMIRMMMAQWGKNRLRKKYSKS